MRAAALDLVAQLRHLHASGIIPRVRVHQCLDSTTGSQEETRPRPWMTSCTTGEFLRGAKAKG
eukprot:768368-Hanusia_phi.AAC.6